MPYRSASGATSGGKACQHVERTISFTVKKIPQTTAVEPTGKVIKGNNNVCGTIKLQFGLMIDYYYIKQKCKFRGGLPCLDYFVPIKDARVLTCDCHGWHQEALLSTVSRKELLLRIKDNNRHCGKSVPPLFLGVDGGTTTLDNLHELWREVWEKCFEVDGHGNWDWIDDGYFLHY
jgi:hypothetical protein